MLPDDMLETMSEQCVRVGITRSKVICELRLITLVHPTHKTRSEIVCLWVPPSASRSPAHVESMQRSPKDRGGLEAITMHPPWSIASKRGWEIPKLSGLQNSMGDFPWPCLMENMYEYVTWVEGTKIPKPNDFPIVRQNHTSTTGHTSAADDLLESYPLMFGQPLILILYHTVVVKPDPNM